MKTRIKHGKDERLVDMLYWLGDGQLACARSASRKPKRRRPEVSIGRTNSKYGLGFWVDENHNFVLNREQVVVLRDYLNFSIPRLKSSGALRGMNMAAWVLSGKSNGKASGQRKISK